MRPKHAVSTKLALYSHDLASVLLMYYPGRGIFGLPGGHVEPKEMPDLTIARELMEELELTVTNLKRSDFFLHPGKHDRIILGYTAVAPEEVYMNPPRPGFEHGKWISSADFADVVISDSYRQFVNDNWPKR